MAIESRRSSIRLALPKGRMQEGVLTLLADARIQVHLGARGYRPTLSLPGWDTKLLKPQNIVEMLHVGSRDVGFAGADWVRELGAEVVELLDTGLNPVRIVAAAPGTEPGNCRQTSSEEVGEPAAVARSLSAITGLGTGSLIVASEYERLAGDWIAQQGIDAVQIRSFGATEAFPPDDADIIVDNTATGSTLAAHGLVVIDELMRSSTRLYANPRALEEPEVRDALDELVLLLRSVLEARQRVVLEVNVTREALEAVCDALPCMREPTIASLHGDAGFAVKAAVRRDDLPRLVPLLKARGASDILVTSPTQIVP